MAETKCKMCRRAGQKLFLKGEKCFSPKCTFVRKPYAPGRRAKRPKPISEYGLQLKEKQKLKFLYGLNEKQFANCIKKSMSKGGTDIGLRLIKELETRLDNIVFRLGLARSRNVARQTVNHGHICVNGRKNSIPSYQAKKGDKISIRPQSTDKKIFTDIDILLKKYNTPSWLKLDKSKKEGEVVKLPGIDQKKEIGGDIDLNSVIEFYSR